MNLNIDNLKWKEIETVNLSEIISNENILNMIQNIDTRIDIATTRKNIFFRRRDGRIIVQPKDGSKAYCTDCIQKLHYNSAAAYYEKEDYYTGNLIKIPYCLNQDKTGEL